MRPARIKAKPVNTGQPEWHDRVYGGRWQRVRSEFIKANPLCAHCRDRGRFTMAQEVDHITPHKGDMELFWDAGNWQPLCKSCHSRKTALENSTRNRFD